MLSRAQGLLGLLVAEVASTAPFECPNCGSQYKLVRVETETALPEQKLPAVSAVDRCTVREGPFILKYFLVNRPRRKTSSSRA